MLVIRGKLLKQIFHDNWDEFVRQHPGQIRPAIHKNVQKMLICGTEEAGFHLYQCPACKEEKKIPHTCKSRFCSKCGVAQTDIWIERYTTLFTNCQYQHVIFSPPEQFRKYFGIGKKPYYNMLYATVNQTLKDWYTHEGYLPGIMDVMHTFGRNIKYHVHIPVLITCGGLDKTQSRWIQCNYLPHDFLKARFKRHFIENIRELWIQQNLKQVPEHLKRVFDPEYREAIITKLLSVIWYVHIGERLSNASFTVKYIGRYTKRPAIAESSIKAYDGQTVAFTYQDHRLDRKTQLTLPVFDFIGRLIRHIPDEHFRVIRYSGFYANRVRGTLLPKVFALFHQDYSKSRTHLTTLTAWWRKQIERFTKLDPLVCPLCLIPLELISVVYSTSAYG
jgi:hypothetical protein